MSSFNKPVATFKPMSAFHFKFVKIPCDSHKPVEEITASKKGGLEADALRIHAEKYFKADSINMEAQKLATATELQKQGIDPAVISQVINNFGDRLGTSVEIIAICIAQPENGFRSISAYCDGQSQFKDQSQILVNQRANELLTLCGHVNPMVNGDCFIGRSFDDESKEWERLDFIESDLRPESEWIKKTVKTNTGRNLSAYSTSGSMQSFMNQNKANNNTSTVDTLSNSSINITPMEDKLWTFTQNDEEVEVRIEIPNAIKSKACKISFLRKELTIDIKDFDGKCSLINDIFAKSVKLCGNIVPGDSTYCIASEKEGKFLTVILAKADKSNWKDLFKKE
jgi:hypothetical protein